MTQTDRKLAADIFLLDHLDFFSTTFQVAISPESLSELRALLVASYELWDPVGICAFIQLDWSREAGFTWRTRVDRGENFSNFSFLMLARAPHYYDDPHYLAQTPSFRVRMENAYEVELFVERGEMRIALQDGPQGKLVSYPIRRLS